MTDKIQSIAIVSAFITELMKVQKAMNCLKLAVSDYPTLEISGAGVTAVDGYDWANKISRDQIFDFILGDFPIGMSSRREYTYGARKYKIRQNWGELLNSLQFLSDDGVGLFLVEPYGFGSIEGSKFESTLNSEGYFINAVFNAPGGLLEPISRINPVLILITKTHSDPIFVAELLDRRQVAEVTNNYFSGRAGGDLARGIKIPEKVFRGFDQLKTLRQMEQLETQYNDFEKVSIGDVAKEINYVKHGETFVEKENSVYIPKVGNSNVIPLIAEASIKHQNYFQVVLDKRAINQYVSAFFKSELGKLILQSLTSGIVIPHLNKRNLKQAIIALPPFEVQKQIITTQEKLQELKYAIDTFDSELALNPISSDTIRSQLDNMLEAIDGLTDADRVKSLARQGESKTLEYKETLSLDVKKKSKQKYIEYSALKTIVAFLNTEGGVLLIGVDDEGMITGVDNEIKMFYKNDDGYLKHVRNLIKEKIGMEYYPYIEYNLIKVDEKRVLEVNCAESTSPCYLDNTDFFIRTNPVTDKLEGPKLVEYVKNHFNQ